MSPWKKFWGFFLVVSSARGHDKPNIIVIIGDDVGWNDFGFHGNSQMSTPNIDALVYNGVVLNNFYTQPDNTASTAAFYTAYYPIRYGLQGSSLYPGDPGHVSLKIPLISERFKFMHYENYLVGKWNLGYAKKLYTPTLRGFDEFYGLYNMYFEYFGHQVWETANITKHIMTGIDLRDGFTPDKIAYGDYAPDLFTQRAVEYIKSHDQVKPMFLVVNHVITGVGPDGIIQDTNIDVAVKKYKYIPEAMRRLYADNLDRLDDSVGEIMSALSYTGMLNNSIVLFMSDNGAVPIPSKQKDSVLLYPNYGSNWPFRGLKTSLYEASVRGTAVIYSPLIKKQGTIYNSLMHQVDLFPTLYSAAGGDVKKLGPIDGMDQWDAIKNNKKGPRESLLLNINEVTQVSGIIGEKGRYKLLNGTQRRQVKEEGYYGDSGKYPTTPPYDYLAVITSPAYLAIEAQHKDSKLNEQNVLKEREDLQVYCKQPKYPRSCVDVCLFDLFKDPCETTNIYDKYYDDKKIQKMFQELGEYWQVVKPQQKKYIDPDSDPVFYNNVWSSWLDKRANYSRKSQ